MQSHLTTKKEKIMRLFGKRNHQFYANNCWFIIDEDVNLSFLIMLKLHRNEFFLFFLSRFKVVISSSLVKSQIWFFTFVLLFSLWKYFVSLYSKHENIVTTMKRIIGIWEVLDHSIYIFSCDINECFFQFYDNLMGKMIHIPIMNLQTNNYLQS